MARSPILITWASTSLHQSLPLGIKPQAGFVGVRVGGLAADGFRLQVYRTRLQMVPQTGTPNNIAGIYLPRFLYSCYLMLYSYYMLGVSCLGSTPESCSVLGIPLTFLEPGNSAAIIGFIGLEFRIYGLEFRI